MGSPEHFSPEPGRSLQPEILDPRHFYAAYVFDEAETRKYHIAAVVGEAQRLGYPVRYWWLSEAMELQDSPDRLIICVHHPAYGENAGMDLFEALTQQRIVWDEMDAAVVEEYGQLGKPLQDTSGIYTPDKTPLFSPATGKLSVEQADPRTNEGEAVFTLTRADIQAVAQEEIGRKLTDGEIEAVMDNAVKVFEWAFIVANSIQACQEWGRVGPVAPGYERPREEYDEDDETPLS